MARCGSDALCELIVGSDTIPNGETKIDLLYEINEQLKNEYADLWSEWEAFSSSQPKNLQQQNQNIKDSDDLRRLLHSILRVERRMKRFDNFVDQEVKEINKELEDTFKGLQNKDSKLEELKKMLIGKWNERLQKTLESQSRLQKDLYTPNGSESLQIWKDKAVERTEFITKLISQQNESSESKTEKYYKLKTELDKINRIQETHHKKTLALDEKIGKFLKSFPVYYSKTDHIIKKLNEALNPV